MFSVYGGDACLYLDERDECCYFDYDNPVSVEGLEECPDEIFDP